MVSPTHVLLVSGSLRAHSTNTAVLRTAEQVAPDGIECVLYDGVADLPHFNPDDDVDPLDPAVERVRAEIHRADAILFSTPEYAGALPGAFKNLLDWTIGDDQPRSIYEKPVAWINVSAHGATNALDSLRRVLGYAHATIVDAACADVPLTSSSLDADGFVVDPSTRAQISGVLATLAGAVSPSQARTQG